MKGSHQPQSFHRYPERDSRCGSQRKPPYYSQILKTNDNVTLRNYPVYGTHTCMLTRMNKLQGVQQSSTEITFYIAVLA